MTIEQHTQGQQRHRAGALLRHYRQNLMGADGNSITQQRLAREAGVSERTIQRLEAGEGVMIKVSKSEHEKCVRCWHHREDVASHDEHPELCGRCVENVAGNGETRAFA